MSDRVREILEKGREAFRNTGNKYPFAYVAYHFAAIEVLSREVDALWKALDHTHAGLAPQAPPVEAPPARDWQTECEQLRDAMCKTFVALDKCGPEVADLACKGQHPLAIDALRRQRNEARAGSVGRTAELGRDLAKAVREYLLHMRDEGKGPCTGTCLTVLESALADFENGR